MKRILVRKLKIPKITIFKIRMPFSRNKRAERKPKENPYGLKPESIFILIPILNLPVIRSLVMTLRLMGWMILDIIRAITRRRKKHLYGIWCFVGLPGAGKTMSLVKYLDDQRRRYGDGIYIITNFYYAGEDKHLDGWEIVIPEYDKPVIFAWDELQNEFNSREYQKFPIWLVYELTQNRKGNGKQIVYTTQVFTSVDKNFRSLTKKVIDCRTYFGRLTKCRHYKREFYEARMATASIDRKIKIKPVYKEKFIQTDYLRNRYDSFQRLDYAKGLDYEGLRPDTARS